MWEVGGIKMERTRASKFFFRRDKEIGEKVIFLLKRSIPENVQQQNFLGPVPKESLHTRDSVWVTEPSF